VEEDGVGRLRGISGGCGWIKRGVGAGSAFVGGIGMFFFSCILRGLFLFISLLFSCCSFPAFRLPLSLFEFVPMGDLCF